MEPVKVRILGCGDAFSSGGRFQTCFYIFAETVQFLIDCGTTSLMAMNRSGIDPSLVDVILLSHLHGDHFGGVPFFILQAQFSGRTRPLLVGGPVGVEKRVKEAMEALFPGSSQVRRKFSVEFTELHDRREIAMGPLAVLPFVVNHPSGSPALALRVEIEGKGIGYSGDTDWTESLVEAARGTELFLMEAYSFEKKIKYHLDYKTILDHREKLDCRRLLLTHMSDDLLLRVRELGLQGAEDGMELIL